VRLREHPRRRAHDRYRRASAPRRRRAGTACCRAARCRTSSQRRPTASMAATTPAARPLHLPSGRVVQPTAVQNAKQVGCPGQPGQRVVQIEVGVTDHPRLGEDLILEHAMVALPPRNVVFAYRANTLRSLRGGLGGGCPCIQCVRHDAASLGAVAAVNTHRIVRPRLRGALGKPAGRNHRGVREVRYWLKEAGAASDALLRLLYPGSTSSKRFWPWRPACIGDELANRQRQVLGRVPSSLLISSIRSGLPFTNVATCDDSASRSRPSAWRCARRAGDPQRPSQAPEAGGHRWCDQCGRRTLTRACRRGPACEFGDCVTKPCTTWSFHSGNRSWVPR